MGFKSDEQRKAFFAKQGNQPQRLQTDTSKMIPPLKLRSNQLSVQVVSVVPSTKFDKNISDQEFKKRIDAEKKWFSNNFGGDTSIKSVGSYVMDNKLIKERVVIVESSMSKETYMKSRSKLASHFKAKRKQWKQDSIIFKVEGHAFIYPKKSFIEGDKVTSKSIPVT